MLLRACLSSPRIAALRTSRLGAVRAPRASLHTTRRALAESAPESAVESVAKPVPERSNKHILDSYIVQGWSEIPAGGFHGTDKAKATWSIWYNHAVVPLYAVIVVATGTMSWFLYRYFSKHTEITFSKQMRGTYDHTGLADARAESHDNRLMYPGIMRANKKEITVFPFSFKPMQRARAANTCRPREGRARDAAKRRLTRVHGRASVSYTHLTLPTICSV